MSEPTGQYTVLRIKRKATDVPVSSLVISDTGRAAKRRDTTGRGVFRLAETVPSTWQGQGPEGEFLKTRIEGLLAGSPLGTSTVTAENARFAAPQALGTSAANLGPRAVPGSGANASANVSAGAGPGTSAQPPLGLRPAGPQYRVVPRAPPRDPGLPPRVITLAELEAARSALRFVDAQAVEEESPEMAHFLPMLTEYLRLESGGEQRPPIKEEDDYVYDLYYRDVGADASTAEGAGALLGYKDEIASADSSPAESEVGDEADEDSNEEDFYRNDYPEDEESDEEVDSWDEEHDDEDAGNWGYR